MQFPKLLLSAPLCLSALFLSSCTGGSSSNTGGGTTTPVQPAPSITSITPTSLTAGAAATNLTVNGASFTSSTAVQVGGSLEATTYVSSTQLTAAVPASQLASGGTLSVIATDTTGSSSSGGAINLTVNNPVPTLSSIVPATLTAGGAATTVSVAGTGFDPSTVVQVNGSARSTSFASSTQVNAILTAQDLATAGSLTLLASNPAPGGGMSSSMNVAVNNPAPGSIALNPSTVTTGATAATTVTITGSNFVSASTVQISGTSRATTYVSATELTFQLTVADQTAAAKLSVTVVNPTPGGGTSTAATLTVAAPTPTPVLTSLSPSQFTAGSPATTIYTFGSYLQAGCTILWNGTAITTTTFSSTYYGTYLGAAVSASLIASAGTASITVNCPAAPAISNALTATISNPPAPTLTSMSPQYGPINAATTLTLYGANFTASTTVSFNGTQLTPSSVSSSSLTVNVPVSANYLPGNDTVTVTNPPPGGGTTSALLFSAYVPIVNNSMIYNPTNGLLYLSVPGSVGAPLGNSIVPMNPATGALGTPIYVGSEPNKMALTADGQYLWVGLDGASTVRKVNLQTNTAGLQFSLGNANSGIYNSPPVAIALVAIPGATDSVAVYGNVGSYTSALRIYDNGVARGTVTGSTNGVYSYSLMADGIRNEIYGGGSGYGVYTISNSGPVLKTSNFNISPATSSFDEMQLLNGSIYTDYGKIYDAESATLLGTLYQSGTTVALGATFADAASGKIFVLDNSQGSTYSNYTQIQVFSLADYTATGATIPITVPYFPSNSSAYVYPTRMSRWGANGLAFRTPFGIYSLESNAVSDLSSKTADLGLKLASTGSTTTGGSTVFTATISNGGPSTATDVVLTAQAPTIGSLVSVTPSSGSCAVGASITCALGSLGNGASTAVTFTVAQTVAGNSTVSAQVSASSPDPVSSNNTATLTASVTGDLYSLAPSLTSVAPAAIQAGSLDTTVTVVGKNFSAASTVFLGSAALKTSYVSTTQMTATIPAAQLTSLGWTPLAVVNSSPGGGTSNALPVSVYSVLALGANRMLYDPYSRKLMASVSSASTGTTGNSIVAISPETATIGSPVFIGSQPTKMALTDDGQVLYTILSGATSVARYNMLTGTVDFTAAIPSTSYAFTPILRDLATQPGTENTVALDLGTNSGIGIYDFNSSTKTAAIRGSVVSSYAGSCLGFLNASTLLSFDIDTTGATLDRYTVSSSGLNVTYPQTSVETTLNHFGCFKLSGGLAYANAGGVADPTNFPALQLAVLPQLTGGTFSSSQALAADASLHRAFYPAFTGTNSSVYDGVAAYNLDTSLLSLVLPLNMSTTEGSTLFTQVDMIRWGQDGLAVLTSGGHIYLLRGAAIVPQLLNTNSAAVLTSSSTSSITHGPGNTLLTLTGSNFVPGVAVTWNGSYRTTTIVDATHVTVAIPASDLASAGSGSLVATNPGASASGTLTVTVN